MNNSLKLNLGCGQNLLPGYLNVDKFGQPDLRCDLEAFPWPWSNNTVDEIVMNHVLEHLGETKEIYLGIFQELYRVCKPNAVIKIAVPHPRSDDFINDPTHVRAVTPESLQLFSQRNNRLWAEMNAPNSPLGLYLDVDFEITQISYTLTEPWLSQHRDGKINDEELWQIAQQFNNVFKQVYVELTVIKNTDDN
jgi:hypothetical protein